MLLTAPEAAVFAPHVAADSDDVIQNALEFVRGHLDMDMTYISEFVEDKMFFRVVNAPGLERALRIGDCLPLQGSYCDHIVAGRLPEMIPDTSKEPLAMSLAVTHEMPVRSFVSVPILRTDGSIYGTFCCVGKDARPSLNARDLEVVRAFASLAGDQVNAQLSFASVAQGKKDAIEMILNTRGFEIALQPILRLKDQGTAGYEALCRFSSNPYRAPNHWFDDAQEV
ncbi:MAG: GAF domain-containing protein, partial [Octadecabacter sp.]